MTRGQVLVRGALLVVACVSGCSTPTLFVGTARNDEEASERHDPSAAPARDPQRELPAQDSAARASMAVRDTAGGATAIATMSSDIAALAGAGAQAFAGAHAQSAPTIADAGSAEPVDVDETDAGPAPTTNTPEVPARLPTVEGQCPELTGEGMYSFRAGGRSLSVQIFMLPDAKQKPKPGGPLILYFHAFGTDSREVISALGDETIDRVIAQGGVVASFNATPCLRCGLSDEIVWYDEDDVVGDQVVACVTQQAQIDTRRIHAVGFSAGALHSMHLLVARSEYIASVISYSGGMPLTRPAPSGNDSKPASLLSYGEEGVDSAVVDFNVASRDWYDTFSPLGYYILMCNHGGGHEIPADLIPHAFRFLVDHPYGVDPEPYVPNPPSELPSYCTNRPTN